MLEQICILQGNIAGRKAKTAELKKSILTDEQKALSKNKPLGVGYWGLDVVKSGPLLHFMVNILMGMSNSKGFIVYLIGFLPDKDATDRKLYKHFHTQKSNDKSF